MRSGSARVARDRNWRWFCGGPRPSRKTGGITQRTRGGAAESQTHKLDDQVDRKLRNNAVKMIERPEKPSLEGRKKRRRKAG